MYYTLRSNIYILGVFTEKPYSKSLERNVVCNIYILGVFTEKPSSKPLESNVVYIRITTSSHATSMTSN